MNNSPRFHENARICECHQTRHSLYQLKSFLQTLQTQPVSTPTLSCTFRNFHATFDRVIKVWLSQTPRILPTVSQGVTALYMLQIPHFKADWYFFLLGMFKMDICLESSKLSIFLEVRQKWHSQQLSNLAKEKKTQYLKTYIIHIIHRQSINSRKTIKSFVGTNRQQSLRFDPTDLNLPMVPHTNF